MPQDIVSQFNRVYNLPIETDRQVETLTTRNAIETGVRWEGMLVYVKQDEVTYKLKGGIANTNWVPFDLPIGSLVYKGLYNATTGTPSLSNNNNSIGETYRVINAGATGANVDFGGTVLFLKNDDIISHNGTEWYKLVNNNQEPDLSLYERIRTIENLSTSSYTIISTDFDKLKVFTGPGIVNVTVNSNSLSNIGQTCQIDFQGSGSLNILEGTAILLFNPNRLLSADGQYSRIAIQKVTINSYRVFGELAIA